MGSKNNPGKFDCYEAADPDEPMFIFLGRSRMGSKNNPGKFDCYEAADPDEPMFIFLGRSSKSPALVELYATLLEIEGPQPGETHEDHDAKVAEARACTIDMRNWRLETKAGTVKLSLWKGGIPQRPNFQRMDFGFEHSDLNIDKATGEEKDELQQDSVGGQPWQGPGTEVHAPGDSGVLVQHGDERPEEG